MSKIEELTEKELRRLTRRDLLALMLEQARQIASLEQAMQEAEERHRRESEEKDRVWATRLAEHKELANAQIALLKQAAGARSQPAPRAAPRSPLLQGGKQLLNRILHTKGEPHA